MKNVIESYLKKSKRNIDNLLNVENKEIISSAKVLVKAIKQGKKILICGNGGSASDAQHFAAELIGRFKLDRRAFPAISLNTDTSAITAIANDYDYSKVFSRQIEGIGNKGDLLFAISTSGKSKNVIEALKVAKKRKSGQRSFLGGGIFRFQKQNRTSFLTRNPEKNWKNQKKTKI